MGHSFTNFTVKKPFDFLMQCSHKRCRCQAFQIKGESRCKLLDEDRFAAPDDFVEQLGYKYYDMSREYDNTLVRNDIVELKGDASVTLKTLSSSQQ